MSGNNAPGPYRPGRQQGNKNRQYFVLCAGLTYYSVTGLPATGVSCKLLLQCSSPVLPERPPCLL